MQGLQSLILQQDEIQSIISGVEENLKEQLIAGLSGSTRAVFIAAVSQKTKKSILFVTHNLLQAQRLHEDLHNLWMRMSFFFIRPMN